MEFTPSSTTQALLDAQLELWQLSFAFVKSMALKSTIDLGIAEAIEHHGGAATLDQIATEAKVHPSKIPCLGRLMRVLTTTGVFGVQTPSSGTGGSSEPPLYTLTPTSRPLVGPRSQVPTTALTLHPAIVSSFFELGRWFRRDLPDPCMFELANGQTCFELERDRGFNTILNDGMVSDTRFVMDIAIKEYGEVFRGMSSLIDVAGGVGEAAQAISTAFPHVECSVLDLHHVIAKAPSDTKVQYWAGDMFDSVPPANAAFLKWVLHDWGDDECVKILKNCKRAIPPRDAGGKVIIIDMVVGAGPSDAKHREMQTVFDVYMMLLNGKERNEQEWRKIFLEAGFSDYKITPGLGVRSIIEVYP